ncbi:hypothetical protein MY04_4798 [Flammeovirga sp. MY04]|uniref:hypothetical protein n=1 Tax=Flammeovirga sp. MY04 TaxID=1191459 RepID=UPI000806383E|nr:hypothetical protein [Flammeovirga sp. MY04]ANQ49615.1 hypothetical protein MY04_2241 [Flammeovirga sp. MY04]ANQ52133.1 hypothetical protein MY04_4798 [Flammeovirga sp. MY04]
MELTQDKIQAWKKEHGDINLIETEDGKQAVIWNPTQSLNVMKQVMTAFQNSEFDAVEVVINNCFIEGDDLTGDADIMGIAKKIKHLLDLPDAFIKDEKEETFICVPEFDYKVKVRHVTRGDITFANEKNQKNIPFDTNIEILKRVWKGTEKEYQNLLLSDRLHLALLTVVNDLKKENEASLKKL